MGAAEEAGAGDGKVRRYRSKWERRQIVEEALKPGASVSLVARTHDVNTNQLFKWRRQYAKGLLDVESPIRLLPVRVSQEVAVSPPTPAKGKRKSAGVIDIDLGHARVRIEGAADPDCVRAALQGLVR